jgi:prepilin-type N-terminal cleavage/methylation domain-containing protein
MAMTRTRSALRRRARGPRGAQAGLTLIEIVITLAVIAIGVVGIAYGFSAAVQASSAAQDQAQLTVAARDLADYVQSSNLAYVVCPPMSTYTINPEQLFDTEQLPAPPPRFKWPQSLTLTVWESMIGPGAPGAPAASAAWPRDCGHSVYDWGIQEITFTLSDGVASVSRTVWKADL